MRAISGRELLNLKARVSATWSLAFSPDGQRLVAAGGDQVPTVWPVARAEQVASWQAEQRATQEQFLSFQRARAAEAQAQILARSRDEASIKQWLILAPIPRSPDENPVDIEAVPGESRLRPRAGESVVVGSREFKWREVRSNDYYINSSAVLGRVGGDGVAYAVYYLWSDSPQRGLRMLIGSDNRSKAYLNGTEVHRFAIPRAYVADQDEVRNVALAAGLNVLVVKVIQANGKWEFSVRFTDPQGNPLKGIQVTLDPGPKL